jgi:hypothetical protein
MQWLKSAMVVVPSALLLAASMSAQGCSGGGNNKDGGGGDVLQAGDSKKDGPNNNPDGSKACQSGLACEVCDVTQYSAPTLGTPIQMKNACTPAELQAFQTACFSSTATTQTCQTWSKGEPDGSACVKCLNPNLQSDTSWGPFDCQTTSSPCGANSGGCVDIIMKSQASEKVTGGSGSCGDLVTTNFGCQDYACGGCTSTDFTTCDTSATANECKQYVDAVQSATGVCAPINGDAAPAGIDACFPQDDAGEVKFLDVFCGTGTGT